MGRYTESDIVQNVAFIGDLKEISIDEYQEPITEARGWKITHWSDDTPMQGRKKSLYVETAIKEDKTVFLINTSPYSNVQDFDWAVFGQDRNAVQEFLLDFELHDVEINEMDSVCQTM